MPVEVEWAVVQIESLIEAEPPIQNKTAHERRSAITFGFQQFRQVRACFPSCSPLSRIPFAKG